MYGNGNGPLGGGMFAGMWLAWILSLVLVVLGIVALAKYVLKGKRRS